MANDGRGESEKQRGTSIIRSPPCPLPTTGLARASSTKRDVIVHHSGVDLVFVRSGRKLEYHPGSVGVRDSGSPGLRDVDNDASEGTEALPCERGLCMQAHSNLG